MPDTETIRLILHPVDAAEARRIRNRTQTAEDQWADDYPFEGDIVALGAFLAASERDGEQRPFGYYRITQRSGGQAIGGIGFKGAPADGVVEVATDWRLSCPRTWLCSRGPDSAHDGRSQPWCGAGARRHCSEQRRIPAHARACRVRLRSRGRRPAPLRVQRRLNRAGSSLPWPLQDNPPGPRSSHSAVRDLTGTRIPIRSSRAPPDTMAV